LVRTEIVFSRRPLFLSHWTTVYPFFLIVVAPTVYTFLWPTTPRYIFPRVPSPIPVLQRSCLEMAAFCPLWLSTAGSISFDCSSVAAVFFEPPSPILMERFASSFMFRSFPDHSRFLGLRHSFSARTSFCTNSRFPATSPPIPFLFSMWLWDSSRPLREFLSRIDIFRILDRSMPSPFPFFVSGYSS